jgi:outer membrane protein TolC
MMGQHRPQGNPPGPNIISRQVSAGVQWTLGDLLALAPSVREAAFTVASSQADETAAENAEAVKTIGLYFDALKARAVAGARSDAFKLANAQHDAAAIRTKAGDAPQLDVVRSDVAVAHAQADLASAVTTDENASEALQSETAVGPGVLDQTVPASPVPINPTLLDPDRVVTMARTLRPEIASARLLEQAARAAIASAKAGGFPLLTFGGGYLVGTDSGVPVNAPTINANLTLPIGPGARDRVAIAAGKALEANAKTASIERQIVLDVAASSRELGGAQRVAEAMSRARAAAQLELVATKVGYRHRASSSLEVTTARSTYTQAVVDELSASYDVQKSRAILDVEAGR